MSSKTLPRVLQRVQLFHIRSQLEQQNFFRITSEEFLMLLQVLCILHLPNTKYYAVVWWTSVNRNEKARGSSRRSWVEKLYYWNYFDWGVFLYTNCSGVISSFINIRYTNILYLVFLELEKLKFECGKKGSRFPLHQFQFPIRYGHEIWCQNEANEGNVV